MARPIIALLIIALLTLDSQPLRAQESVEPEESLPLSAEEAETTDETADETTEVPAVEAVSDWDAKEQRQLEELEQQAQRVLSTAPVSPALPDSDAVLREILARPEFATEAEKVQQGPSLVERFFNWLAGLFNFQTGTNSAWLISLTIVLSLLIIYLIVRMVWEMMARRRVAGSAAHEALLGFESGFEALLAAARKALAASDYRSALRYRYLASLSQLDLPASALLTNSQILRQMRKRHPGIGSSLGQMVQRFEDVWYGGASCDKTDYNELDALAGEVEQVALSGKEQ